MLLHVSHKTGQQAQRRREFVPSGGPLTKKARRCLSAESINKSINQSINKSINQSINIQVNQSVNQLVNQSVNQLVNH